MTRRLLLLVLVLAATSGQVPAKAQAEAMRHSEFGLTYFRFDYAETLPPPSKSQEKGWIPGLRYVSRDGKGNSRKRTQLELAIGTIDYDGALQDASGNYLGPYMAKTPTLIFKFERDWGKARVNEDESFTLTPYFGLGYRLWFRGHESDDPHGYDETYQWVYLPLGARAQWRKNERLSIGLDASARPIIFGRIAVSIPGYPQFTGSLGRAVGWRIEMPISLCISEQQAVELRPWYEFSKSGKGNIYYQGYLAGYEPDSTTRQSGATLSLLRSF